MFDHEPFSNVRVLTHSAIRMESEYGAVLYFDPFDLAEEFHDADAVIVTHSHYDHFSPEDIKKVAKDGTILIAPESCASEVAAAGLPVLTLAAGEATAIKGNVVHAVPAYNVEPERLGFHPKENDWLGYLLVMDDSPTTSPATPIRTPTTRGCAATWRSSPSAARTRWIPRRRPRSSTGCARASSSRRTTAPPWGPRRPSTSSSRWSTRRSRSCARWSGASRCMALAVAWR